MSSKPKIAILGAGFSGLVIARELVDQGLDVQVFEASPRWGGLAQSFEKDIDGGRYIFDFGPHYITNRLAETLGVMDECVHVPYAESIHHRGRLYAFPFGLMVNPLFALGAGLGLLRPDAWRRKARSAAEFFKLSYGGSLAKRILCPLVRKWSGVEASALSVDFVDRVPPPSLGVLYRKLLGVVTGRSIQTMPNQGIVYHVAPRQGIQLLSDRLAEPIADRIFLDTKVERILVEDGRACAIEAGGQKHPCDFVVSTLPLPVLPDLIEGSDALAPLRGLRFRPILLGFLVVHRPRVLDRLLTWFPDPGQIFYRLSEQKIACAESAPEGSTLLTVEITCDESDPLWSQPTNQVRDRLTTQIGAIYGLPKDAFGPLELHRTRYGYPMYDVELDPIRKDFVSSIESGAAGIANLHVVGRSGRFQYILLEESHRLALAAVPKILKALEPTTA